MKNPIHSLFLTLSYVCAVMIVLGLSWTMNMSPSAGGEDVQVQSNNAATSMMQTTLQKVNQPNPQRTRTDFGGTGLADDKLSSETGSATLAAEEETLPLLTLEPASCRVPVADYTRVFVNRAKWALDQRTYDMLVYAAKLYGGDLDITDTAVIQGSYIKDDPAHSGVYAGGGVVDIAPKNEVEVAIRYNEIPTLIRALRTAGFAAWFREAGEMYEGSPAHIHAVAIGDRKLSPAARKELIGEQGYFRGFSGISDEDGAPKPDQHGGAIICDWMLDMGYEDMRDESTPIVPLYPSGNWQERLRLSAESYIANSEQEAIIVAKRIDFVKGNDEHPATMCGPLSAAILRDAGMLPINMGPATKMDTYWLANPHETSLPFSLFPAYDYDVINVSQAINVYDFVESPLYPGDFIYSYASRSGYDHIFVVTEVDADGGVYTVSNQRLDDGSYCIKRVLLYDVNDPTAGVFKSDWISAKSQNGQTGIGGFTIVRRKGGTLPAGEVYTYTIEPGDTLMTIASKFNSTPLAIVKKNPAQIFWHLQVGNTIQVPVNIATDAWNTPGLEAGKNIWAAEIKELVKIKFEEDVKEPYQLEDILPGNVSQANIDESSSGLTHWGDDPNNAGDDLVSKYNQLLAEFPSGDWGLYVENLESGEVISIGEDALYHTASTIKISIGAAFLRWWDDNQDVSLDFGPVAGGRSFKQLLTAMLIKSEEEATVILTDFLEEKSGYDVTTRLGEWGLNNTTIYPRRTKPSDQALLLKRLYYGELLSETSTNLLFEILRTPSHGDDVRIGGGLPEWARSSLAHKTGTVFDDGWGVVADAGLVNLESGTYVVVVIGNYVDWLDYDEAEDMITEISQLMFEEVQQSKISTTGQVVSPQVYGTSGWNW